MMHPAPRKPKSPRGHDTILLPHIIGHLAKCLLVVVVVAFAPIASASEPSDGAATVPSRPNLWSAETELVQPLLPNIGILRFRVTRVVWGSADGPRGDLVLGLYIRPNVKHDILERIHEYMGTAGYRQYVWKGAHIEGLVNVGAAWGTNQFDNKRYETASVFAEANIGYRFAFREPGGFGAKRDSVGFFVTPQFGVITTVGIADIGPRNGKADTFLQGALFIGASW
jgi:hypothetical protein